MVMTEKQLNGEWFICNDPDLKEIRVQCSKKVFALNQLDNSEKEKRYVLFRELFGNIGEGCNIKSSFQCDYGSNIYLGNNVFVNVNCVFTDVGKIEIGDDTFIGPQVGIYTVNHPLDPVMRKNGLQRAENVKIGQNCWIGGNVTIKPGVTLGDNVEVASGAVVTKSFEDKVLLAGVPAKVIKEL